MLTARLLRALAVAMLAGFVVSESMNSFGITNDNVFTMIRLVVIISTIGIITYRIDRGRKKKSPS